MQAAASQRNSFYRSNSVLSFGMNEHMAEEDNRDFWNPCLTKDGQMRAASLRLEQSQKRLSLSKGSSMIITSHHNLSVSEGIAEASEDEDNDSSPGKNHHTNFQAFRNVITPDWLTVPSFLLTCFIMQLFVGLVIFLSRDPDDHWTPRFFEKYNRTLYQTTVTQLYGSTKVDTSFVSHIFLALLSALMALIAHIAMCKMFETMESAYHIVHVWSGRLSVLLFLATCVMGFVQLHSKDDLHVTKVHMVFELGALVLFIGLPLTIRLGYIGLHRLFAHVIFYSLGMIPMFAIICRIVQATSFPEAYTNPDFIKEVYFYAILTITIVIVIYDAWTLRGKLLERKESVIEQINNN